LVLGGAIGIGKDTLLEPLLKAVGIRNCAEVSPVTLLRSPFNEYLKSIVLRISEARDLGNFNGHAFYDHTKPLLAAPPDVLRVNEKHIPASYVPNVTGVVITTNHRETGIYLPRDDRRHYVAWSNLPENDVESVDRCDALWVWYRTGGMDNVVAYLRSRDLTGFKPKAPPPKTSAFYAIASANVSRDESELADVLNAMAPPFLADPERHRPEAVTLRGVGDKAEAMGLKDLAGTLRKRECSRQTAGRLSSEGYTFVKNPDRKDGQWRIGDRLVTVYARRDMHYADQVEAAKKLAAGSQQR